MLKNLQIGVIIKRKDQWGLRRIPPRGSAQDTLTDEWNRQYKDFMDGKEEIPFTTSYEPTKGEYFSIRPYELDRSLANTNSLNASRNTDNFDIGILSNSILSKSIKGIVAFMQDGNNNDNELMLFQNFSKRQIIRPGRASWLAFEGDSYEVIKGSFLGLDDKLAAVYSSRDEKLLFNTYPSASKVLDLSKYYYVASNEDIRDLLEQPLFECEDMQKIVKNSKYFHRRRFAMLKNTDILEKLSAGDVVSVRDVKRVSTRHNLGIQVRDDKIVFPENSDVAKTLLQLLNEEIYQGELSGTLFQANSKRPYERST